MTYTSIASFAEWADSKDDESELNVWEDNWDDDNVEDDFNNQLRAQLESQKKEKKWTQPNVVIRCVRCTARSAPGVYTFHQMQMKFRIFKWNKILRSVIQQKKNVIFVCNFILTIHLLHWT